MHRRGHASLGLVVLGSVSFISTPAFAERYALIASGGLNAKANNCAFYSDMTRFRDTIGDKWKSTVLWADGSGMDEESAGLDVAECQQWPSSDKNGFTGSLARNADDTLKLQNTVIPGAKAATKANLDAWVKERAANLKKGDTVLLYFTDHGLKPVAEKTKHGEITNLKTNVVAPRADLSKYGVGMWNESMTEEEYAAILSQLPEKDGANTVLFHDHCFSGAMLRALFKEENGKLIPLPNRCGFAASAPDELTYSGGIFHTSTVKLLQESLEKDPKATFRDGYDRMWKAAALKYLPESTSDVFLDHYSVPTTEECATVPEVLGKHTKDVMSKLQKALINRLNTMDAMTRWFKSLSGLKFGASDEEALEQLGNRKDMQDKLDDEVTKATDLVNERQLALNKAKETYYLHMNTYRIEDLDRAEADLQKLERDKARYEAKLKKAHLRKKYYAWKLGKVTSKLAETKAKVKKNELELAEAKKELAADSREFKRWLDERGEDPYGDLDNAKAKLENVYRESLPARRLLTHLSRKKALKQLIEHGSMEDKNRYLALLECENTVIR